MDGYEVGGNGALLGVHALSVVVVMFLMLLLLVFFFVRFNLFCMRPLNLTQYLSDTPGPLHAGWRFFGQREITPLRVLP